TTAINIDGIPSSGQVTQATAGNYGITPDVVQEFRLVTNTEANNGWTTGPTIEIVTKSGTNQFHGSVYDYLRNDAFDSRSFLASKVTPQKQTEFGGVIGGPIKKDKHFFIASIDRFTFRTAQQGV